MINVQEVPRLQRRLADTHKGSYGRVLVIAGSESMSGAAILCGSAALKSGAGLVQVATPPIAWPIVASGNPCYMTIPWDENDILISLIKLAKLANVLAVGPGLGLSASSIVAGLLSATLDKPIVLDADALNALGIEPKEITNYSSPLILTPHMGEFARLLGKSPEETQASHEELAVQFATRHKIILLLKGHKTLITDGERIYRNTTGNPGMATGGSGDILTGILAALIGQGFSTFEAAILGVWVHGRAGDLAAAELGETALTSADLLDYLPKAFRERE